MLFFLSRNSRNSRKRRGYAGVLFFTFGSSRLDSALAYRKKSTVDVSDGSVGLITKISHKLFVNLGFMFNLWEFVFLLFLLFFAGEIELCGVEDVLPNDI